MKYPRRSPYLSYKRIGKDEYIIKDYLHSTAFLLDSNSVVFLKNLDGRTNPYKLLAGHGKDDIQKVIKDFKSRNLLAPKKKLITLGIGSCIHPLFYCYPGKTQKILAKLFNLLVMLLFIPVLILGLYFHSSEFNQIYMHSKGELYAGMLLGVLVGVALHELSHICAGLAYGGHLFEIGVGTHFFIPMGYVLLDDKHIKSRVQRIQINAAGVEMNLLLYGVFMSLASTCIGSPFVIYLAAIENLVIAIFNLLPLYGLDGFKILSVVLGKNDLLKHARKVIKQRKRKRSNASSGFVKIASVAVSYALIGFQIIIPIILICDGICLIRLILL